MNRLPGPQADFLRPCFISLEASASPTLLLCHDKELGFQALTQRYVENGPDPSKEVLPFPLGHW